MVRVIYLQWQTTSTVYRTVPLSTILNNPVPRFQAHAEYLRNGQRYRQKANRKPYPGFVMVSFSMTLSDS